MEQTEQPAERIKLRRYDEAFALRTTRNLSDTITDLDLEQVERMILTEKATKRRRTILRRLEMRALRLRHNAAMAHVSHYDPKPRR